MFAHKLYNFPPKLGAYDKFGKCGEFVSRKLDNEGFMAHSR